MKLRLPQTAPGRAAMEAVANPSRTKDLYFVADGSGGHAFAETHEQHLRNVARWRQVERARAPGDGQVPVDRVEPESLAAPAGLATGAASAFTGDVAPASPGAGQPPGRTPPRGTASLSLRPVANR